MTVYSRLFDWMVARLNQSLGSSSSGKSHFIGILDIFGFEIFEKNSFEQLCINYANEKLQQQFNTSMFKEEEGLYEFEKIEFQKVPFKDNTAVLNLIEGKPDGVLLQLDDEVRVPGGSDQRFLSKLIKIHQKNACFKVDVKKKVESALAFQIVHYTGSVKYDAQGFLQANTDILFEDLCVLGNRSSDAKLANLFPMEDGKPLKYQASAKKPTLKKSTSQKKLIGGTKRVMTISNEFRDQLNELLELLESTESRYIRCIKPNSEQQRDYFESKLVLEQLKCSGVFEAVEIRRKGFPFRWTHRQFVFQYKIINKLLKENVQYKSRDDDYEGLAAEILENAPGRPRPFRDVQVGKTRVLYRAKEHKLLSLLRNLALHKTIPWLQARLRGYIARKMKRVIAECDELLQDAIDMENDIDAIDDALNECDKLIGDKLPILFPGIQPTKLKEAERLLEDLKKWVALEEEMENLENDPREPVELFFELRDCLARCDALEHIPKSRRQERLVDNLRDKVESCQLEQHDLRWIKWEEIARAALESLDYSRMKLMLSEYERDEDFQGRNSSAVEKMKEIIKEMDELDVKFQTALNLCDRDVMTQLLKDAEKYPRSQFTDIMKECEQTIALNETDFCKLELEAAIRSKDEKRRIHREIRLWEIKLGSFSQNEYRPILEHPKWKKFEDWIKKTNFFIRTFQKEKLRQSFKTYSSKPIGYPLTNFGDEDSTALRKRSITCTKLLYSYFFSDIGSGKAATLNPDDSARSVLNTGLSHPILRYEIIFYCLKMISGNPNELFISKIEEFIGFCLLTFPLDDEFQNWMFMWSLDRFGGSSSPECKKYWAAMFNMKYSQPQSSSRAISQLRKEWGSLVISNYAIEPGKSTGPSTPEQLSLS